MSKIFLTLGLVCLHLSSAFSQQDFEKFNFLGINGTAEVPFRYIQGFIIVEATLNELHSINLILDTGAQNTILFHPESIELYGMETTRDIELMGSDMERVVDASICRGNLLSLHEYPAVKMDLVVLKEDIPKLSQTIGYPVHGLLGGRALWGLVLSIDFEKEVITLTRKSEAPSLVGDLRYEALPIEVRKHKPYLKLTYTTAQGEEKDLRVLVDTGSALPILIFTDIDSSYQLPDKYVRAPLGQGIGGKIMGFMGKIQRLSISDLLYFPSPICHLQEIEDDLDPRVDLIRNGLIGNPILSRFHIIIDYVDQKMYLRPNAYYRDKFAVDMTGMQLIATGRNLNRFVVGAVIDSSPAAVADIRKGDEIRRIGLTPAGLLDLSQISKKLMRREGKRVRLIIRRDGQKLIKSVRLRDYLK